MGYDIMAYMDVDQNIMNKIVSEGKFDVTNWEEEKDKEIKKKYKEHFPELDEKFDDFSYFYNPECKMHEFITSHGTNFIRDDERFSNRRYIKLLEDKIGEKMSLRLQNINWTLRTREDAVHIAKGLRTFFPEDNLLQGFANWCDETSKLCSTYELSY